MPVKKKRSSKQPHEVMIVNDEPNIETRIAILENGVLEDLYCERQKESTGVGNIYKGRVTNVESAIQAAFIDYGSDQRGFLHITDVHPKYFPGDKKSERVGKKIAKHHRPPIQKCFKRGDEVLVQVLKEGIGTKNALTASLVGWVILCFAALSFAPLEYSEHSEYQVQIEEVEGEWHYTPHANLEGTPIAVVEGGEEQIWAAESLLGLGIVQEDGDYSSSEAIYKWAGFDDEGEAVTINIGVVDQNAIEALLLSFDDTRFSISILDVGESVGVDHPTNLGDGSLDAIPETVRSNVWEPLGLTVGLQFLLLGCAMGTLLGGSQGLARSMFGQMVPETRSAEFFGFFGFFGKVAALLGPLIYGIMTVAFDSRVGIFSISIIIFIGTVLMRYVDVDAGRADAAAEDARNRGLA